MGLRNETSDSVFPDYYLGMLAELAPVGICVLDGDLLAFRWANRKALELFGEPFASFGLTGRTLLEVLPEAEDNGLLEAFRAAAGGGEGPFEPLDCEFSRGGSLCDWRWSLHPLGRLKDGAADIIAVVTDVTDSAIARAKAEEQASRLEVALKRSGSVLASLSAGLGVFDLEGRLVYANQAARDLGVQWDQLAGVPGPDGTLLQTIEGQPVPRDEWPLSKALRGQSFADWWLKRTDPGSGRNHLLSYGGAAVRDDRGRILLAALTLHDVRERIEESREREMLLRTLEREQERSAKLVETIASERDVLALVMEGTDTQLAYLDAELRFVTVNEAFARSTGFEPASLVGRFLPDALPEEVPLQTLHDVLVSGRAAKSSGPVRSEGGYANGRYVEWTVTPVPGAPQPTEGLVLTLTDMTHTVRARQLSEALNGINLTLSGSLRTEEVLQQIVLDVHEAVDCDSVAVALSEGAGWTLRYANGLPEELLGTRFDETQAPPGGLCARIGRPVHVEDALADAACEREVAERWGVRAAIGIPFMVRGRCEGILFCNFHRRPHRFLEADLDFATKLAASASLAFENSRLYESEHQIAHTLQEALLSMPPRVEGVRFGHLYRSAVQAARVGGDFYDVFPLGSGRVGLVVGDVSGKGLEAAALTSLVRESIKAHSSAFVSPSTVVTRANEVILRNCDSATFVTLFFGILDVPTGHLEYCSAGHPPPMLKRPSEVLSLRTRSPLVGALEGARYRSDGLTVDDGDVLVLYTDGLIEAHNGPEMYGEGRLRACLAGLDGDAVEDVPEALFMDVFAWVAGELSDDVAVLAVALDREDGSPMGGQARLPLGFE